ncbi:hypothetical protein [Halorientalis marina]|jgi:hypothetical protein|uniref:hypothetical protein n=1 Tax=Halorientalis marina TaxID=2931976 RepID=UPI001FF25B1D|nr:hypothetical protein [Halorientalis marina]
MTDANDTTSDAESSDDEPDEPNTEPRTRAGKQRTESGGRADGGALDLDDGRSPATYLYWGAFAVLLLLALIAVVRFYMSASRAISIWIAPDYEPVFQSAFNLAVLFACGAGLSVLVRRRR